MRIMIAYDDSRNAKIALDQTVDMFLSLKPTIILIGVVEGPLDSSGENETLFQAAKNQFRVALNQAAQRVASKGLVTEVIIAEGDARKMILKASDTRVPDLLVVARHSHEPDKGLLSRSLNLFVDELDYMTFGSVSAFLARRAQCPIMIQSCP